MLEAESQIYKIGVFIVNLWKHHILSGYFIKGMRNIPKDFSFVPLKKTSN